MAQSWKQYPQAASPNMRGNDNSTNLIGSHLKLKRKAPSPPEATEVEVTQETVNYQSKEENDGHEALGIKLSATLRNTFGLN